MLKKNCVDGRCECGGYIVFESILQCGKRQAWRCIDCNQAYFRNVDDMRVFKTIKELEEAKYEL